MKREDLEKLGLTDKAQVDAVMELHGKDIEAHKTQLSTSKTQIDSLTEQVAEASRQIEGFKKMDVDSIRAAADDWKAKAEQAQRVFDYYQMRYLQKTKVYGESYQTGQAVLSDVTVATQKIQGTIEKMSVNLTGGFACAMEITGAKA